MGTAVFDTLAYAKKLREAGVPEKQAEVQAEALAEIADEKLATKEDIRELKGFMEKQELRIVIKLGTLVAAAITIVSIIVNLSHH